MPDTVARFTISIPPELLAAFDDVCAGKGYASRSEAVRDALRDYLVAHEWAEGEADREGTGTVTLVYDAAVRGLAAELAERRRQRRAEVLSCQELVLDDRHCLQVVAVRGRYRDLGALADALVSLDGVSFGRLVCVPVE
jgi:CopG family nickel-responsive transcriptional regulator